MHIETEEQLRKIYEWPKSRAGKKVLPELEQHSIHFISKSPFFVLSTYDTEGNVDASPRGGAAGFIHIKDDSTLVIPDAKGNNRVDSLVNIVSTGRVGLLFLIPGVNETLRVNGSAVITTEVEAIDLFSQERNRPLSCLIVNVEEVFLHCAKAFMRSDLWGDTYKLDRSRFPSMGKMLNDQLGTDNPIETQEEMVKRYAPDL